MRHINYLVLLLVACSVGACSSPKNDTKDAYPMFWTWLDYQPGMNFDSICTIMNEAGIDGVMLNAPTPDDYRAAIPIAQKHGIEVYAWLWTMNPEHDRDAILKEHPEWFSVNRNGQSLADTTAYVDYYKFMCPALPEVREFIKKKIEAYCEVEGLNGIAIDYNRFVDVILPTTLWPKYGIVQDQEYPQWDFGYHPAMIEKFKALVETQGTVAAIDDWGKRRLAYPINDLNEGHYVLMTFTSAPELPAELDRVLNITEGVIRHIITDEEV